jgi:hypothetical protein
MIFRTVFGLRKTIPFEPGSNVIVRSGACSGGRSKFEECGDRKGLFRSCDWAALLRGLFIAGVGFEPCSRDHVPDAPLAAYRFPDEGSSYRVAPGR